MKLSEFIELLKTYDPDANVHVIEHREGHTYYDQGGWAYDVLFDKTKHITVDKFDVPTKGLHCNEILIGAKDL